MLVERDGRYELVNTSDVQVVATDPQIEGSEGGGASSEQSVRDRDQSVEKHKDERELCKRTEKQTVPLTEQDNTDHISKDDVTVPSDKGAESSVHDVDDIKLPNVLSATSTYALGGEKRVNIVGRTKSAPGLRNKVDESGEIKQRNEAAFSAWLAAKNEEIAKRRQAEREELKRKEDMLSQKQGLNEAAYKTWLEKKTSELQLKRICSSRPATSVAKSDKARKQAAFEAWMNSKRDQHRKKVEEERERQAREEEKAKNSDPTLVEQAYKKYG